MGFGGDSSALAGGGITRATEPGIFKCFLEKVDGENPSQKEDAKDWQVINFRFRIAEGPNEGLEYIWTEWDPQGDEKKEENAWKRVGHIIAQFLAPHGDEEKRKKARDKAGSAISADNYEAFRSKVLKVMESIGQEKYSKVPLEIKLLGEVVRAGKYKGQTRLTIPRYVGFLTSDPENRPIKISPREAQGTAAFFKRREELARGKDSADSFGDDADDFDTSEFEGGSTDESADTSSSSDGDEFDLGEFEA